MSRDAHPRTDRTLELEADRLLRENKPRGHQAEYPYYSRSSLRQMSRREESLSFRALPGVGATEPQPSAALDALITRAGLTDDRRALLELFRSGASYREIGDLTGLTPKAVRHRLERIIRRLRNAAQALPHATAMLRATYEEQTRPCRYSPEQHCDAGREVCRYSGLCPFRWYLYSVTAEETAE